MGGECCWGLSLEGAVCERALENDGVRHGEGVFVAGGCAACSLGQIDAELDVRELTARKKILRGRLKLRVDCSGPVARRRGVCVWEPCAVDLVGQCFRPTAGAESVSIVSFNSSRSCRRKSSPSRACRSGGLGEASARGTVGGE